MDTAESETPVRDKRKAVSILLSIFFGPFTWLYTFKRDSWKLALGLGFNLNILIPIAWFSIVVSKGDGDSGIAYVFLFALFVLTTSLAVTWIWAVIDSLIKPRQHRDQYPKKDETIAALLALFAGPWTWLYTYPKDKWKLWSGLGVAYFIPIISALFDIDLLTGLSLFALPLTWLVSIMYILFEQLGRPANKT